MARNYSICIWAVFLLSSKSLANVTLGIVVATSLGSIALFRSI